jgi:hypothetical protein
VTAGHDEDHRQQAGDRYRVEDDPRPPESPAAAQRQGVEEGRNPIRIDDRRDTIEQRNEVEDEDAREDPRGQEQPQQLGLLGPEEDASEERE